MTESKTEKVVETIEHSFEGVLGVPPGTTEIVKTRVKSEPVIHEDYDHKDSEIEDDFVKIYDKAMELFENLLDEIEDADQSKRARIAEVANQTLSTALNAAEKRKGLKQHIDILKQKERAINKKAHGGKQVNNLFIGSHEKLIDLLDRHSNEPDDSTIIDVEPTDTE
jgi:hypothetical protein